MELTYDQEKYLSTNKVSQSQNILAYMREHGSITQLDAFNNFGCFRLGARIWDLKNKGNFIKTETEENNGKRYARYFLFKEAK